MEATMPRFRLKVIATGSKSNDDITVVLFEDVVANLIGKSAATVLASLIEMKKHYPWTFSQYFSKII
ncbi:hypothetical protein OROHE_002313 [Orobanche hederae]